ncbi:Os03g0179200 [Oryza sativa Japonica Group]|jgi:hypothetical protein|uniref:Os03g0179200 protein n=1 Tax=Oryza sativa subsp. japonica TaxID=39947 RepID=A0A0P0VTX0_ORYSJ|nr:hypothetical protein EE612_015663 [Oryza sativa]KAF2937596.1 hypothetical protein DAI22_03g061400 [Oryza sativa Japonica Group]BAS82604.1 Os03g0179200 [Oryza sativa Japonica Group]
MGISSASYHPPTLQLPSSAVGASRRCGSPDWVMLDETAYISDRRNKSTAESQTSEGQIIQVSFWLVDPPGLSYFTVHCPGLEEDGLDCEPSVLAAEGSLVLFRVKLSPRPMSEPMRLLRLQGCPLESMARPAS